MKVFIKIALLVLGFAGVVYWFFGKLLQPAYRLRDRYKRPLDEDQLV